MSEAGTLWAIDRGNGHSVNRASHGTLINLSVIMFSSEERYEHDLVVGS